MLLPLSFGIQNTRFVDHVERPSPYAESIRTQVSSPTGLGLADVSSPCSSLEALVNDQKDNRVRVYFMDKEKLWISAVKG